MAQCPKLAHSVLTELHGRSRHEVLNRFLKTAADDPEFCAVLERVALVFATALDKPGEVDKDKNEIRSVILNRFLKAAADDPEFCAVSEQVPLVFATAEDELRSIIERRFWIIFFESLAYAAQQHHPEYEKGKNSDLKDYEDKLRDAIKHAEALADKLKLLQKKRNELEMRDYAKFLDPSIWFMEALQEEGKSFDNPVFEQIETMRGRYINARYWPEPEGVIGRLDGLLSESLFNINEYLFQTKTKTGGLLKTLIDEFDWCRETCFSWHLPKGFINNLSGQELAVLINVAWGIELKDNSKSTVNTAKKELHIPTTYHILKK